MEKFNTDGIVIKTSVTGESDLIVFVLTRTRGIIRAFAKGARGMKNKLHAGSSLFAYCDFTVTEKNEVYHINEAAVKDIFFGLRGDIARLTLAQYFCEVLLKTLPDGEADEEYLNLTLRSLYYLSGETKPILQIKAVFELRMAAVSGYAPPVHACADCGAFQTDMMFFNCLTGELFCDKCGKHAEAPAVPFSVIAAMRHILFSSPDKVFSFRLSDELLRPLTQLTEKYLQNCMQQHFRLAEMFWTATNET